jgi:signal transduction histidine kinase
MDAGLGSTRPVTAPDGGTTDASAATDEGVLAELNQQVADLQDQLATAQEDVRRAHERLETFGGQVGHDLRNPLTSMSMSLQMLAEHATVSADDEVRWMVERALSGATRLNGLIEELLQYARLSARLNRTELDLSRLVADVVAELSEALDDVSLEVGPLPMVCGDRQQVAAVLHHLVANAVTFTRIDVPVEVRVTGERTGSGWRVEVADNGPGVPPEDRKRIFEPHAGQERGGLVTSRRIVKAHGGRIGMSESAAGGALVWFELPF